MVIGHFYFTTAANLIKIIEEQDEEINPIYLDPNTPYGGFQISMICSSIVRET